MNTSINETIILQLHKSLNYFLFEEELFGLIVNIDIYSTHTHTHTHNEDILDIAKIIIDINILYLFDYIFRHINVSIILSNQMINQKIFIVRPFLSVLKKLGRKFPFSK